MKKRLLGLLLALSMVLTLLPGAVWAEDDPSSEAELSAMSLEEQDAYFSAHPADLPDDGEPAPFTFLISTAEQLHDLALKVNGQESYSGGLWASASYRQVGDLDLSGYAEGEGWTPIGKYNYNTNVPFSGSYDGGGYQITGLTINGSLWYRGLFGVVDNTVIQNVHIVDCSIAGAANTGALIGSAHADASIFGCSASGKVAGTMDTVGGIVGHCTGKIGASFSTCDVSGTRFVGGIVGLASMGSSVENCWSSGSVSASEKSAGGISGGNVNDSVVRYCYTTATISAPNEAGGISGLAHGPVEYCAALNPSVTGSGNHVAAVDATYGGSTSNCYAWDGMAMNGSTADLPEGVTAITVTGGTLNHQLSEIFGASEVWTFADDQLPGFGITYDLPDYMTAEPEQIIEIDSADKLAALATGINTGAEFQLDGKTVSAGGEGWTFVQTADIDLSGYAEGEGWTPIGYSRVPFQGSYDGGGYDITGLTISRSKDCQGLFGCIQGAVIQNVHIVDCTIKASRTAGALVGTAYTSANIITGCSASGTVSGEGSNSQCIGGIAGYFSGKINTSFSMCAVSGKKDYVGGIAGQADAGSIENCWSSGSVSAAVKNAGGIVGNNSDAAVKYCYSTAAVSAPIYAGGIVGQAYAPVESCAALNPSVTGGDANHIAEVNETYGGSITGCYAWDGMAMNGSTADLPEGVTPITVTDGMLNHQLSEVFGASEVWVYADNMLPGFGTAYDFPDYMSAYKTKTIIIDSAEDLRALSVGIGSGKSFLMDGYDIPSDGRNWTFLQTCDIDLSGYSDWMPIGGSRTFGGTYDGDGYEITGLTINSSGKRVGLFCDVYGTIKNVHVVDCSVQGDYDVGALVGYLATSGTITGCSASGTVSGAEGRHDIGGIVGFAAGSVYMCSADCTVSGASYIGGIAGYSVEMIANCHSSGVVTASSAYAGGICGAADNTIQYCYSTAAVYAPDHVGGIVGGGSAAVKNCAALNSSVTGENNVQYIAEEGDNTAQNSYVWANMTVTNSYGQVTCISDTITISEGTLSTQLSEIFGDSKVWTYADNQLPGLWGGTYDLPYYITSDLLASTVTVDSAEELKALADGINDGQAFMFKGMRIDAFGKGWTFLQTSDIDLSQYADGAGWTPIGTTINGTSHHFDGAYDGLDHAISGLTILKPEDEDPWPVGLFGSNWGSIQNIHVEGCNITGIGTTGGIAGNNPGTIQNCSVTGSITAYHNVGAIVGVNNQTVQNCYSAASIRVRDTSTYVRNFGGICGSNLGALQGCWSLSTVSGPQAVGGIVGFSQEGSIQQCAALGSSVAYTSTDPDYGLGGRIAYNYKSTVTDVYAWSGMTVNGATMEGQQDPCESVTAPYDIGELYVCDGYVYTDKLCATRLDWSAFGMTEENGWQDTDTAGYLPTRKGAPRIVLDLPQQDSPRPDVNVTVTLTHLTTDFTESTAKQGVELTMTLTPDAYYQLPETVAVTAGGAALTAGTDYTYDSGTGVLTIPAASVSGDVTITADGKPQTYAVTLNLGGGKLEAGKELTSYTYAVGAALPTEITRTGYTFGGWFESEDFGGKAVTEITDTDTGDKTYYAKWDLVTYQIHYVLNGGTNPEQNPDSYTVEDTVILSAPSRKGYVFQGWRYDGAEKPIVSVTLPAGTTGDYTFTAVWEKVPLKFEDVPKGAWYYDAITWGADEAITLGTTTTTFSPERSCTRAQILTFLWRYAGMPTAKERQHPFTDVDETAYYYEAMLWGLEQGITTGTTSTTFSPYTPCTRGQIAAFLWRYSGKPKCSEASPFLDVAPGSYCYDAVAWAAEQGITKGVTAATFCPNRSCTRAQGITMMYRFATR